MNQILTLASVVWIEMVRRKDLYVLLILMATLLGWLVSFNVFGLSGVVGYIKDMGGLAVWILAWILAVNTSVRQLPQELQQGTLFPLLAKPVTRLTLILGKWLGAWTLSCFALVCLYLTLCLGVSLKGGRFDPMTLFQALLLHAAALSIICAIGIALSTRMNRDAATVTTYVVTGAAFLILPRVPAMLVGASPLSGTALYTVYYLFPHLELFDLRRRLVHDWGAIPWPTVAGLLAYASLLTIALLTLAWLNYRKRHFSRGDIP
jgi:ABC-type transport system involved in multi-copper enzyme maturation permease subunit